MSKKHEKKIVSKLTSSFLGLVFAVSFSNLTVLAATTNTLQQKTDLNNGQAVSNSLPVWNSTQIYTAGTKVQHNEKVYEAKWWTQGFAPDTVVENSWSTPWQLADATSSQQGQQGSTDTQGSGQSTTEETSATVVYPDYSSVNVGEGVEWKDTVFAPFVDSTAWPAFKLSQVSNETKVPYYNLGFIVSKSSTVCEPTWGTYYSAAEGPLNEEIKKIRQMGGDVIVSFGGAANVPLHVSAPNAETLKEQYKRFIKAYKLTRIDFDIEGAWIRDTKSLKRNNEALKMLQDELKAEGYNLDIWFTLPVLPTGLDNNGVNAVKMALDAGVIIDGVNVMTMDYGDSAAPNPKDNMAEYGIQAITNLHNQLKELYTNANIAKTDSELWKMVGTTPMIGMNDVQTEIFDLEDARQTLAFAKEKGIGMLSMWSANRDKANPNGAINYVEISSSSIVQQKFEFSKIFNGYNTTDIVTLPDAPNLPTSMPVWNSSESYTAGTKVQHKGKTYKAKWWTQGFAPDTVTEDSWSNPWELVESDSTETTSSETTPTVDSSVQTWNSTGTYTAGTKVQHKGKIYEAKWWTQGFAPDTITENSWSTPWKLVQ